MRTYTLSSFVVLALLPGSFYADAQCIIQVTHGNGTELVNNTNVGVTRINFADTMTTYCSIVTTPYVVGFRQGGLGSGTGHYGFQFSPPVSAVTLNFSGVERTSGFSDEVAIEVNGSHYAIPAAGTANGCDDMAVLTAGGNITGNANGLKSGWKDLTIPGPITALKVEDIVTGAAGGVVFSLFVCETGAGISAAGQAGVQLYPNPFKKQMNITTNSSEEASFTLYNMLSGKVMEHVFTHRASIDATALVPAMYYYELKLANGQVQTGKLVKE